MVSCFGERECAHRAAHDICHVESGANDFGHGFVLKKQIWIWPIIAVVLLSVIGLVVRNAIETTMKESLRSQVATMLDVESAMMETWFNIQKSNAESLANSLEVRQLAYQLLEPAEADAKTTDSAMAALRKKLEKALGPAMSAHDYARLGHGQAEADRGRDKSGIGRFERCSGIQWISFCGVKRGDDIVRSIPQRCGIERFVRPLAD